MENSQYKDLSMSEKATIIRQSIKAGITNLTDIEELYNHRYDGLQDTNPSYEEFIDPVSQYTTTNTPDNIPLPYIDYSKTSSTSKNKFKLLESIELKKRQAWAESRFRDDAVSPAGAKGRFQIMENVKKDYIKAGGEDGDLHDPKYNEKVRDWVFSELGKRPWVDKENSSDSIKVAKVLAAYNAGPTNVVNRLNKAKSDGIDIYNSFDWVNTKYMPEETVDYVNWILRHKANSILRNDSIYNLNKHRYSGEEDITNPINNFINTLQTYINGTKAYIMNKGHDVMLDPHTDTSGGRRYSEYDPTLSDSIEAAKRGVYADLPQSTFLFSRDEQRKAFEKAGYYIDPEYNYGLVKKAVGDNKYPVYKRKDVIDRDQLEVIHNPTQSIWLGDEDKSLDHPGSYPSAIYMDKEGRFYQNAWDLNDYGESSAGEGGVKYEIDWSDASSIKDYLWAKLQQTMANTLDKVGNPFVVSTGIQHVDPDNLLHYAKAIADPKLLQTVYNQMSKERKTEIMGENLRNLYNYFIYNGRAIPYVDKATIEEMKNKQSLEPFAKAIPFEKFIKNLDKYTSKEEQLSHGYLKD